MINLSGCDTINLSIRAKENHMLPIGRNAPFVQLLGRANREDRKVNTYHATICAYPDCDYVVSDGDQFLPAWIEGDGVVDLGGLPFTDEWAIVAPPTTTEGLHND